MKLIDMNHFTAIITKTISYVAFNTCFFYSYHNKVVYTIHF